MRIISMTATFGKLDGETLELEPGLNVLSAPNEWGKSTWCAFLTAMFYGIETRERTTADRLAEKERFQPWSGKPMEGSVRLEYQGRDITIQRRTRGKVPMGEFQAYETLTGMQVPELTASNCGQVLLGVDRAVFRRSGFVRLSDLPVEGDEALRSRLNAMVTTGDESGRAEYLAKKLRELKNRCQYKRSGLIPECQEQIRTLQDQLHEQEVLLIQAGQLEDRIQEAQRELDALDNHRDHLAYRDAEEDQVRVAYARSNAEAAEKLTQAVEEKYADVPPLEEVRSRYQQGMALLKEVDETPAAPPEPVWQIVLLWVLAAAAVVFAIGEPKLWALWVTAAVILAGAALLRMDERREAEMTWKLEMVRLENRRENLEKLTEYWSQLLQKAEELDHSRQSAQQMREHYRALCAMARSADAPQEPDTLDLSAGETMQRRGEVDRNLRQWQLQLAQISGKLENLPDGEILAARLEQERDRLRELERTYRAVEYAQCALESALRELQRRFAPRITRRAEELLRRMTGGTYDRIAITDDLGIQAARDTETTLRTVQWRSDGTGDQMYLALRFAVWEVLAPDAPLVLDDALVRFDQTRMEAAMEVLKELANDRQIILMSCQRREKEYLQR